MLPQEQRMMWAEPSCGMTAEKEVIFITILNPITPDISDYWKMRKFVGAILCAAFGRNLHTCVVSP